MWTKTSAIKSCKREYVARLSETLAAATIATSGPESSFCDTVREIVGWGRWVRTAICAGSRVMSTI